MDARAKKILESLHPNKIFIPVIIGLIGALVLVFSSDELDLDKVLENIKGANYFWVGAAFLVLLARDAGYIYRIRHLTDKKLSWLASVYVIVLWEFASAITPSVVGGTAIAIFIINKEGIAFGKSLSYVMLTAVLDNSFFVLAATLVFLFYPATIFPDLSGGGMESSAVPLKVAFWISVGLIALYNLLMLYGLLLKPRAFKFLLIRLTSNRFLRRFRSVASQSGQDMIVAAENLRGEPVQFWLKAIASTLFVWSARYFMLNCLIAAFSAVSIWDHFLIFARQIIMWIVMLVSPTPGSSGTAEYTFSLFFGEFFAVGGLAIVVALTWRLFTYYAYLVLGVLFLPKWIQRVFYKKPIEEATKKVEP